jgi:hypothetical protein
MIIDWSLSDRTDCALNDIAFPANDGRMWTEQTYSFLNVARTFDADTLLVDPTTSVGRPWNTLFVRALNNKPASDNVDGVALMTHCVANNGGNTCFAFNPIASSGPGATNPKLVAAELDLQFKDTDTAAGIGSAGLLLNVFGGSGIRPGSAIMLFGHGGAMWQNGLACYEIASGGGCLVGGDGARVGSLVHTGNATYDDDVAVILNARHRLAFYGTGHSAGGAAKMYNADDVLRIVPGSKGAIHVRSQDDRRTVVIFDEQGNLTTAGSVIQTRGSPPSTSTSPCVVGQQAWDRDYEYRCVAPNTWRRAALSAW